ncbi:MAG TPA: class I SAM-dependent methyltransferase [Candidatus Tectomicrobia bacterium]|nr:class I SAM-dependent methyltransferase [Candidatus Tectomicrobia bacterium]
MTIARAVLRRLTLPALAGLLVLAGCAAGVPAPPPEPRPELDVPWVVSPPQVIAAMLDAAEVTSADVVYDLGCGDGAVVVTAARRHGARGVCVELDPLRLREARENAARAGVSDRITFVEQDLFQADIRPATVVTLYLLPEVNVRLRPKLLRELRPGTRVVSHDFDMEDWVPERTILVPLDRMHRVFLWRIPDGAAAPR